MIINKKKKWVHVIIHAYGGKNILYETDIKTSLDIGSFTVLYRAIRTELRIVKEYNKPEYLAQDVIYAMKERRYIESNSLDEVYHIENAGCKN